MEWLNDRLCDVIEISKHAMIQSFLVERNWNQWFLSKKSFCTRRSKKRRCFRRFDHKAYEIEESSVKQYGCRGL